MQKLGLQRQRQAVDFVKKHRAAPCMFKFSGPRPRCPRKGPRLMAEQFAFDHVSGECGTVDRHKRAVRPFAGRVKGLSSKPFACARLANDQHVGIAHGNCADLATDGLHFGAETAQTVLDPDQRSHVRAQPTVLDGQSAHVQSAPHRLDQPFRRIGLFDKVICPLAHHGDGEIKITMSGDEDHRELRVYLQGGAQKLGSIHSGHADVGDKDARKVGTDHRQRRRRTVKAPALQISQLKRLLRCNPQRFLVIDEKNWRRPGHSAAASDGASASFSVTLNTAPPSGWLRPSSVPPKSRTML